ncbi:MAG: bifunctional diguanylate cyclase/phosphodiesterase [Peptostreptococcaceae bacterium]
MNSFKKIYKKLTYIILISMLLLITANVVLLLLISDKYTKEFFNAEANAIYNDISVITDSLKKASYDVANNKEIISILEDNNDFYDISQQDKSNMLDEISLSEGFLHNLSFVDTINIISVKGNYLFSNGALFNDFYISDRPWYHDSMLNSKYEPFSVPIHKDYTTGEYTTSIVSFILNNNDEVLGIAILDIYIEDLLKYIESRYSLGDVSAHMIIDGSYYPPINEFSKILYHNTTIDNISLVFDKSSSIHFSSTIMFLKSSVLIYILIFLLIIGLVLISIKKLLKPVEKSLIKFKSLLGNKQDLSHFSNKGELEQLEILSEMLSKSFDNTIHNLIYYNDFTNLPNKKSLIKITNDLIKDEIPFALIFIHIENLKTLIDLFGYNFGDKVIKDFSNILSSSIQGECILTEYSHNKFVLVYPNYTSDVDLDLFYKKNVLDVFENNKLINNSTKLKLSGSVSIYPSQGDTLDKLLRKNEFMIDISKRHNWYNKLLYFNDEIYNEVSRIESIKQNLKTSIENNEFTILYQPILDKNRTIKKAEALIRWKNKELGCVSPVEFIKYAEETGDIVEIGYWIFEDVCKNYNKLNVNNKTPIQVSINVSPIQLLDDLFAVNIIGILNKYKIDSKNICIEITESVLIENNETIVQNLNHLSNLGIYLALDDFGTGYSSFGYLKQFNFNILKLDKIFIDDASECDYNIIKDLKSIAKKLNTDVVIEGVETKEQFDNLLSIDIDYFQGYYFSKPLSLDDLIELSIKRRL